MGVDPFRRFTWFFHTDNSNIRAFFDSGKWKRLTASLNTAKLRDLKGYRMGNNHFLVADALPDLNHFSLRKVLKEEKAFRALIDTFELNKVPISDLQNPLERIYELDQKLTYAPEEGQLKTNIGNYKRFVWTLLLEPDLVEEYKNAHGIGRAWPEITNNMKSIGIKDMEIYLYESRAILIMDTFPDFDLEEVGPRWQQLPREAEWQAYVARFQRTDPNSDIEEKWEDMEVL
ncbi:MAG: L-rhamnose mutarotase [Bacteroidota bacterium]